MTKLITMDGYGIYVWSTYFITILVFVINLSISFYENRQVKKVLIETYESQTTK